MGKRRFKQRVNRAAEHVSAPITSIHYLPNVKEERFAGAPKKHGVPILRRALDAGEVNPILNAPGVFEFLATSDIETLDCSALLEHELNVVLVCEGGAVIFFCQSPGIYDVWAAFLPGWRGAYAVKALRLALAFMFIETDCMAIRARVPADNKPARRVAALIGGKLEFHRNDAWPARDGAEKGWLVGMFYLSVRFEDWILSEPDLSAAGRSFIDHLFGERRRLGGAAESHDQDLANPRFIGAFARMADAGQLDKAVILYNRFASFALLPTIALVSRSPAMVEVGGTLIQIKDGSFKAILLK